MRSDGGAWIVEGASLASIGVQGETNVRIDLRAGGFGAASIIGADAYDGSVWVATDRALLLHFALDGTLVFGTTLPAPARAVAIGLAQDVWVVTGDALMKVTRDGRAAASSPLGLANDERINGLAVDSFRDRVWLATSSGLYHVAATDERGGLQQDLRGDATGAALDPRSGRMLAIVDETIVAFDDLEPTSWLQAPAVANRHAVSVLYDAADDTFVVEMREGMLRIANDGTIVERSTSVDGSGRVAVPLRFEPTLALLRPPSGGAVTDSSADVVLLAGARCNGRPCAAPAEYLSKMRIRASIDGLSLGEAAIDTSGRVAFPMRPPMHTGENVLSATLTDIFGHVQRLSGVHWTHVTRTPAANIGQAADARDAAPASKAANKAPSVALTTPSNGAVFAAGSDIGLAAAASDPDGSITKVEFYRGSVLVGTATGAPYTVTWKQASAGSYALTAKAYDDRKASTTSFPVSVVVVNNQSPTVVLTSPAPGAFASAGSPVTVAANASDADGTIARVDFFDGATPIGVAAAAPYRIAWTPGAPGVHSISATATDDKGGSARSPVVDLTVGAPPIVVMTTPGACATMDGPLDVILSADATSATGKIASVEFFDNGTSIGAAFAAPWRAVLVGASIGDHVITASATDDHGLTVSSRPSIFTVRSRNQPPTVALTAPADGTRFPFGGIVNLEAVSSDADGTVSAVEFRRDGASGELIARATTSPYTAAWSTVATGTYAIVAVAYDDRNASSVSTPIRIVVDPNVPPTVTLTAPTANSRLVMGKEASLVASAGDSDGSVARVDFYADAMLIGSSTTGPYSVVWTPASPGTYSLTARATDNAGALTTSAGVPVTVMPNALPTVSLTAASPDGDLYAPATIVIAADAYDSDGTVVAVDFYAGATLIGRSSAPPFRFFWDGVSGGTYALTAAATDDSGGVTVSSPISITVAAGPSIAIDPALPGAMIDDDNVLVRGFVSAPTNAAVTVNGLVVHVDDVGRFNANEVPLVPGTNAITVEVVTQSGQTSAQSIVVDSSGAGGFVVHASPTEGLETLQVTFTIENPANTPFKQMLFDLDNDGFPNMVLTPDQFVDGKLTVTATYPEGTWLAVLKAYDDRDQVIYSTTRSIVVRIPQLLQSKLLAVYDGMLTRLRAGNVAGALTAFTGSAYDKYSRILTQLQPSLAEIVDQLGQVTEMTFDEDVAELTVVRNTLDGARAFLVYLVRSEDGIWRVDAM